MSIIITYKEYRPIENLYTESYWNQANQLRITKNYINYLKG
jgi:hypothetical protein